MKKTLIALFLLSAVAVMAQKPRPDAFPPVPDTLSPKAITMATTLEEMDTWDKYPTYEVYMAMMQRFVDSNFPPFESLREIEVHFPWNRMFEADIVHAKELYPMDYFKK